VRRTYIHDVLITRIRRWAYAALRRRLLDGEQLDLFRGTKLLT